MDGEEGDEKEVQVGDIPPASDDEDDVYVDATEEEDSSVATKKGVSFQPNPQVRKIPPTTRAEKIKAAKEELQFPDEVSWIFMFVITSLHAVFQLYSNIIPPTPLLSRLVSLLKQDVMRTLFTDVPGDVASINFDYLLNSLKLGVFYVRICITDKIGSSIFLRHKIQFFYSSGMFR